ncbi:MAG TPA: LCP family protein [Pseudonocardiaceae bacterium]|nr:LCP family protein [Pseudonocardiaceae bacterium]
MDESTSEGVAGNAEQDAEQQAVTSPPAEPAATDEPEPIAAPVVIPARHRRKRRPWLITGRAAIGVVSAAALVASGIAWYGVQTLRHNTNTTPVLSELNNQPNQPPPDDGATDILLVGDDARTDAQGHALPASALRQLRTTFDAGTNTDTIIVLRIPKNGGKAYAVSIPRDTYVSIPGWHQDKINAAYGVIQALTAQQLQDSGDSDRADIQQKSRQAGQLALIESVQGLTGIHIDHYAEVNLYGFYLLSQAIGGVPVCLKHATSDKNSGADFKAGVQTVSGSDALSFVRQRDNLPNGDLDRIVRQQVFLASAAKKLLSAGTLTNPGALGALAGVVRQSLTTDPGLDIITFAQQAQSLASGNVEFVTIPVVNDNARSASGQSIVQVDVNAVHQFVTNLIASSPPPPTTTQPTAVSVPPAKSTIPPPPPTTTTPTTTTPPPPPPTNEPTSPVSIDGVPCVD